MARICVYCGEFYVESPESRPPYCTEGHRDLDLDPAVQPTVRKCVVCEKEFAAKSPTKCVCSAACAQKKATGRVYPARTCDAPGCTNTFTPKWPHQKRCSPACSDRYQEHKNPRSRRSPTRVCAIPSCVAVFVVTRHSQKYCPECRKDPKKQAAYRLASADATLSGKRSIDLPRKPTRQITKRSLGPFRDLRLTDRAEFLDWFSGHYFLYGFKRLDLTAARLPYAIATTFYGDRIRVAVEFSAYTYWKLSKPAEMADVVISYIAPPNTTRLHAVLPVLSLFEAKGAKSTADVPKYDRDSLRLSRFTHSLFRRLTINFGHHFSDPHRTPAGIATASSQPAKAP